MKHQRVVPFKIGECISCELINRLLLKGRNYGINAIFPFSTDKIVVARWVHLKCRYGCKQYNTNWTCPPAAPSPEEVNVILGEYSTALLLAGSKRCEDFYRDNTRKRAEQVRCWKGTVSLERMLFLEGYYKAFSLVGECCALCSQCAYPEDCRFPQEKRPPVEAFSIDVIATLRNLGTRTNVATDHRSNFNYYAIVLLQ